ncbi:hypothetical protein D3C81_1602300 [compost metagenome]
MYQYTWGGALHKERSESVSNHGGYNVRSSMIANRHEALTPSKLPTFRRLDCSRLARIDAITIRALLLGQYDQTFSRSDRRQPRRTYACFGVVRQHCTRK